MRTVVWIVVLVWVFVVVVVLVWCFYLFGCFRVFFGTRRKQRQKNSHLRYCSVLACGRGVPQCHLGAPACERGLRMLKFPLAGSWQCILAARAVPKMDDTCSLLSTLSYGREPYDIIATCYQNV